VVSGKERQDQINDLLADVLAQWVALGEKHGEPFGDPSKILHLPDGEPHMILAGWDDSKVGGFIFYYRPRTAIQSILEACEKRYDDMLHGNLEVKEKERETITYAMAKMASVLFLSLLKLNTVSLLMENMDEALKIVESSVGAIIQRKVVGQPLDARQVVDALVKNASKGKRKLLIEIFGKMPAITVSRTRTGPSYAFSDEEVFAALRLIEKFSIKALASTLLPRRADARSTVYDWMKRRHIERGQLKEFWKEARSSVGISNP
jgi:hypothetical protein